MLKSLLPLLLICLLFPARLHGLGGDDDAIQRICARVQAYKPGPLARPTEEDRKLVDSGKLTPGIVEISTSNQEYDEIRRYCLVKGDCNSDLAMIFANGWGVKRDYDAATYFLCGSSDQLTPDEEAGMLKHVEQMRSAARPTDLQYCDYVGNGAGGMHCAQVEMDRTYTKCESRIAELKKALTPEAVAALDALMSELSSFAQADSGVWANASGLAGTWLLATGVSEQNRVYGAETSVVERFTTARAPASKAEDFKQADADLNRAYAAAKALAAQYECGTCSDPVRLWIDALREAQREWIKYREAWAAYYVARWRGKDDPSTLRLEIVSALTLLRAGQLRDVKIESEE